MIGSPTIKEQEIVRSRIKEKIAMKPSWYRKTRYDQNLQYLRERLMIDLCDDIKNIEDKKLVLF